MFSHFRLVGSGRDDPNISADITSVGYDLTVTSISNGALVNRFDLYMFAGNDIDYNCFVMGAQLWTDFGVKQTCDFVTMRPDIVRPWITDYKESNENFLNSHHQIDEVFLVVDNSGWWAAIQNPKITPEAPTPA